MDPIERLYSTPVQSRRSGALFSSHPYPTRIDPVAIVPFLLAHTRPGDTVFDGFAGTGSTGLAAVLCADPDDAVVKQVSKLVDEPEWGARHVVMYDISQLAGFIAQTLVE